MNLITYKNKTYPKFQTEGNASQFAIPFAKHFCIGNGVDIGCNRVEWSYPGSLPIDISFNDGYDAYRLPNEELDYIYSSHCLEHLPNYVQALEYWYKCLKFEGILFLYLPDYSQEYWQPWNNRKHLHAFTPTIIADCLASLGFVNILKSEVDLNNSFMVVAEKL